MEKTITIKNKQQKLQQKKKAPVKKITVVGKSGAPKEVMIYRVPECVKHYLSAVLNPFTTPVGACLPCDLLPLNSQKVVSACKGSFATGTTGFGFLAITPSMVGDGLCCQSTTITSVGSGNSSLFSYTNVVNNFSNSPYTTAQFASGVVAGRNVTYGVRVRSTTSAMNRGGSYVIAEEMDDHTFDLTATGYLGLKTSNWSKTKAIPLQIDPESWDVELVSSGPVIPTELQYTNNIYGFPAAVVPCPLLVCVNSATPGQTFDYEFYIHTEFVGQGVGRLRTPSHPSPNGFSAVIQSAKSKALEQGALETSDSPTVFQRFRDFFSNEGPQLMQMGAGAARMLGGDETGVFDIAKGGLKMIADAVKFDNLAAKSQRGQLALPDPSVVRFKEHVVPTRSKHKAQRGPIIMEID